ncbi:MAG: cytochrome c [Actinomycetota bacterium]|nr:cytochrome c [Actinomycetota bacterium]
MPRTRSIMTLAVALAVALAACGDGASDDGSGETVDSLELSTAAAAGLAVFEGKCAVCHRPDLSGGAGPALGPASAAAGKPVEELRRTITEGGNGMPSWGGVLSAEEIDDVLTFLVEAQGR